MKYGPLEHWFYDAVNNKFGGNAARLRSLATTVLVYTQDPRNSADACPSLLLKGFYGIRFALIGCAAVSKNRIPVTVVVSQRKYDL